MPCYARLPLTPCCSLNRRYRTYDAARKHCRDHHLDWLYSLRKGDPGQYCTPIFHDAPPLFGDPTEPEHSPPKPVYGAGPAPPRAPRTRTDAAIRSLLASLTA